jgi:hypothetical protein
MRVLTKLILVGALAWAAAGCGPRKSYDGPTVDAFTGRLTQDGKPVAFPEDEKVKVMLFHEKGQSFGIPIRPDGSFKIGWMPIGKYSAMLVRDKKKGKGQPTQYRIPGGLTIAEGKTEYTIELGKDWKP